MVGTEVMEAMEAVFMVTTEEGSQEGYLLAALQQPYQWIRMCLLRKAAFTPEEETPLLIINECLLFQTKYVQLSCSNICPSSLNIYNKFTRSLMLMLQ